MVSFEQNKNVIVQSTIFVSGVPQFFIKVFNDFKFECYHDGVKCYIPSLSQNRITTLNRWSILDEAIKYLSSLEQSRKSLVLSEYREAISSVTDVGSKVYSPAMLIRAFQYYACSRSAYKIIRNDHQLPSAKR